MSGWAVVALVAAILVWIGCLIIAANEIVAFFKERRNHG